uniref:Transposase n=1 Tax=Ascaris lumbricoides TaxID=6252 RepID=A0A0M3I2R9_ASCLU
MHCSFHPRSDPSHPLLRLLKQKSATTQLYFLGVEKYSQKGELISELNKRSLIPDHLVPRKIRRTQKRDR